MIHTLLNTTGIRASTEDQQHIRTEFMQTHGFRKFFKTTCINSGMNPLYSEYMMGHSSGLINSYFKPTDEELLEGSDKLGYTAAIPYLTIDATEEENQQLKEQITQLRQHTEEWELLRHKVDEIRRKMGL